MTVVAAIHEDNRLAFQVDGQPVPWQRARSKGNQHFTSPKSRAYKRLVGLVASTVLMHRGWPMDARYSVTVHAYFGDKRRRDVDNVIKQVLDGLNGIAWEDDHQVDAVRCCKYLENAQPRLVVEVEVVHP